MKAGIGWIDFSHDDRNRVFSVMDLLREGGSVDELGIGTVRDSIADWLFPGVSTIHTRPKYFIIIAQILSSYTQNHKNKRFADYLNDEENRVMHLLVGNHKKEEGHGVIGINVAQQGKELARKPSSIYWNGLKIHGIIKTSSSLGEYLRMNDLSRTNVDNHVGEELDDEDMLIDNSCRIQLPDSSIIDENVIMELTAREADFLYDVFISTEGTVKNEGNLLRQLLVSADRRKMIIESNNFEEMAIKLLKDDSLMDESKNILRIALNFDFLLHGAHIRYNIKLPRYSDNCSSDLHLEWEEWLYELQERLADISMIDFDYIFSDLANGTDEKTQLFFRAWLKEVTRGDIDVDLLDRLVYCQEVYKKKNKAKLHGSSGEYADWVGIRGLEYRFKQAQSIIKDIQNAKYKG
ncbi:MAG: hypothetical protein JEZ01_04335 [Labilibaculum sp.]|nr:DUF6361 family protein [Labilibaculum sp.]MBI9056980.1 hypothetical protein [Labilibaculum sp.]